MNLPFGDCAMYFDHGAFISVTRKSPLTTPKNILKKGHDFAELQGSECREMFCVCLLNIYSGLKRQTTISKLMFY